MRSSASTRSPSVRLPRALSLPALSPLLDSPSLPYEPVLCKSCRATLGDRHPLTVTSMNNMAGLLQARGKLDEAATMCWAALEASREVLGDRHPSTLAAMNNMSRMLQALTADTLRRVRHDECIC